MGAAAPLSLVLFPVEEEGWLSEKNFWTKVGKG